MLSQQKDGMCICRVDSTLLVESNKQYLAVSSDAFLQLIEVAPSVYSQEVAGPNQTYPSILGMLGIRLHVDDEEVARILEKHGNNRKGVKYSLVRNYLLSQHYESLVFSKQIYISVPT